ncbi:unnamed protein product, partial [Clonostachys solani]
MGEEDEGGEGNEMMNTYLCWIAVACADAESITGAQSPDGFRRAVQSVRVAAASSGGCRASLPALDAAAWAAT